MLRTWLSIAFRLRGEFAGKFAEQTSITLNLRYNNVKACILPRIDHYFNKHSSIPFRTLSLSIICRPSCGVLLDPSDVSAVLWVDLFSMGRSPQIGIPSISESRFHQRLERCVLLLLASVPFVSFGLVLEQ